MSETAAFRPDIAAPARTAGASASIRLERRAATPVRHATLLIDPANVRRFHHQLALRLSEAGVCVTFTRGRAAGPPPASLDLLFRLERLFDRTAGPRLSDRIDLAGLAMPEAPAGTDGAVAIDFCGAADAPGKRGLRVLYDSHAGESVLLGALLAGRQPTIEILDVASGRVVSRGTPAADNANTVLAAFDCVLARVLNLVVSAVRGWSMLGEERGQPARTARMRDLVRFEARALPFALARALYHLCCHAPHWRTLWRHSEGVDLWDAGTLAPETWRIVPDPGFRFYADPFPFAHGGTAAVFVEDFDHRTQKGIISAIPFGPDGPTGPAEPVLEEPWHLSFPFVFAEGGEVFMIPESSANRTVELYRADPFPRRWVHEATLLAGIEASDVTITREGDRLWMLAATRDGAGSWSDMLSIFSARDLRGPWLPHPGNPVMVDASAARSAGAFFRRGGRLFRPVQDCAAGYGTGLGLVEILDLGAERYEQALRRVVRADAGWPGRRLHTWNRAGRLEVIDGSAHSPRSRFLAKRLEGWSGRRQPADPVQSAR